jgi:alpha-L-fucosidase 2
MLVQSTLNEISVLPALPKQWPNGSLTGVRVRGGAKVDIDWNESRLTAISLRADRATKYRIVYGDHSAEVELLPGRTVMLSGDLQQMRN